MTQWKCDPADGQQSFAVEAGSGCVTININVTCGSESSASYSPPQPIGGGPPDPDDGGYVLDGSGLPGDSGHAAFQLRHTRIHPHDDQWYYQPKYTGDGKDLAVWMVTETISGTMQYRGFAVTTAAKGKGTLPVSLGDASWAQHTFGVKPISKWPVDLALTGYGSGVVEVKVSMDAPDTAQRYLVVMPMGGPKEAVKWSEYADAGALEAFDMPTNGGSLALAAKVGAPLDGRYAVFVVRSKSDIGLDFDPEVQSQTLIIGSLT